MAHRFIHADGYGRYAENFIRALSRLGVDVTPMVSGALDMPGWLLRLANYDFSHLTLQCMPAYMMKPLPGRIWGLSMTEDDTVPDGWAETVNQVCERLIVPCEHNADVFKRRGVIVPVHVVHGGTSPEEFPVLPSVKHQRPFTFLALCDRGGRKGDMEVYSAFYREFGQDPNVRLVLKIRKDHSPWLREAAFAEDKRVTLWREDTETMADVYAQVDCLVFASHGEGWGMPPREAAMMGLPVIATRWSGLEVGLDCWGIPLTDFALYPSPLEGHEGGQWAVPTVEGIAKLMRWVYDHQDEARQKGLAAAQWLREHQSWEHSARQLLGLMEQYAWQPR